MAKIKAFAAIRPKKELTPRIAALPYDVYSRAEAKAEVEREPLSFLKIDRAETILGDDVDTYAPEVYQKAHDTLWEMVEKGEFVRDPAPCFYLYELTMQGRTQTGLVACASIDDYENGVIEKHENTRADKEEDRIRHVDRCNAQTGPIFLAYRKNPAMEELTRKTEQTEPLFDFIGTDGIRHKGYRISQPEEIREIEQIFETIPKIYIADGHHRAASAVKVGEMRRAAHPGYDGTEEFNWFLAVFFPDDELKILDYNRVVKDLNGLAKDAFLEKVKEKFEVEMRPEPVVCAEKGELGMYLEDTWYRLKVRPEFTSEDPVEGLDVSYLQRELLGPVLGIRDPKTDGRIDFIGGIRGLGELERRVQTDAAVAFAMHPTSITELFTVADAGELMPPKSTWFEPKLRSGLFLHEIDR
ncbi:MAG: DUF1015 domain-containing protein [Eubacteriales bacterium]|nr:DUF1015 domain-containing protein [Eubacteriales bacterium]